MARAPRENELQDHIDKIIVVDHTLLARAKDIAIRLVLVERCTTGRTLVEQIVKELGARDPGKLLMHPTMEFDWAHLTPYGEYYSTKLAACEAIWQLIHNGLLIPGDSGNAQIERWKPRLETGVPRGYSGSESGVNIIAWDATFPTEVLPAPSLRANGYRSLTDGDLFLRDIGVAGLHPLIDESLREAVKCFRQELYLPCLAMLTKGIEGCWTEMGMAIADFGTRDGDSHAGSLRRDLENPRISLKGIIDKVAEYYRKPVCDPIEGVSNVRRSAINQAAIWSDEVRDSRNVLHFGKSPSVPITYERVAVLLMATVGHVRAMYAIKEAADTLP